MSASAEYYTAKLYPFQNGVLRLVRELSLPFYLTGGTALSRHYFGIRYSDDIDLFVNQDARYKRHVDVLMAAFEREEESGALVIDRPSTRTGENFTQVMLARRAGPAGVSLKVDLVNDTAPHLGPFEDDPVLGRVDGWRNILSNKVCAAYRYEPKDIVDLWAISRQRSFTWPEVLGEARAKDAGVDVTLIYEIVRGFPRQALDLIKWGPAGRPPTLMDDLSAMADDILRGQANSLFRA